MLKAKGIVESPSKLSSEALGKMNDFAYRKEFGLSHKQFLAEPFEVFMFNSSMMGLMTNIQKKQTKQLERKSQR